MADIAENINTDGYNGNKVSNGNIVPEEKESAKDNTTMDKNIKITKKSIVKQNGDTVMEEQTIISTVTEPSSKKISELSCAKDTEEKLSTLQNITCEKKEKCEQEEETPKECKETTDLPGMSRNLSTLPCVDEASTSIPAGLHSTEDSPKSMSSASSTTDLKTLEEKLNTFKLWCDINSLTMSEKVSLQFTGTSHRYGMMATSDVKRGETLFTIPRKLLLNPDQGSLASELLEYEEWLEDLGRSMDDSSGWVPLLITLMHEFTRKDSFWAPYLNLVPETCDFGHPLFWDVEEMKEELSGMTLLHDLTEDRKNIEEEYKLYVLPFLIQNKNLSGSIEKFSMVLFKRMIAFVMAYSFTEDQDESPSMIPMADMLNHHSNNNANLVFERDCLKMISCKKIDKGEEIFNTFGRLGNAELLQMYGYTEEENHYNAFPIYVQYFVDVIEKSHRLPQSYLQAMVALMHNTEIALSYDYFVFDKNGLRRGPDLIQFLKILHMSEAEFDNVLKTRAGCRPDSFYQKLLRKLKLAKKTDMSSGVAVIDITDDDNDGPSPAKRKCFQLNEVEEEEETNENDSTKRQCLYEGITATNGTTTPLSHFLDSSTGNTQKLTHYPTSACLDGNTSGEPIVIDDESDEEEVEPPVETVNIDNSMEDSYDKNESESRSKNENESDTKPKNENESDTKPKNENESESAVNLNQSKNEIEITEDNSNLKEIIENESVDPDKVSILDDSSENIIKEMTTAIVDENVELKPETSGKNVSALGISSTVSDTNSNTDTLSVGNIEKVVDVCNSEDNDTADKTNNPPNTKEDETTDTIVTSGVVDKDGADDVDEVIEEDPTFERNEDEDDDDIEIVSEDAGCILTYEKMNEILKPVWKETINELLNKILLNMKKDDEDMKDRTRETLSRNKYNAWCVRRAQRILIQTFLDSLS